MLAHRPIASKWCSFAAVPIPLIMRARFSTVIDSRSTGIVRPTSSSPGLAWLKAFRSSLSSRSRLRQFDEVLAEVEEGTHLPTLPLVRRHRLIPSRTYQPLPSSDGIAPSS